MTAWAAAWRIDYRIVPWAGSPTLVSAMNVLNEPVEVPLDMLGQPVDLVTGETYGLANIQFDLMEFVLLEVK